MNLPAASILGYGAVTPLGRDISVIARKLQQPEIPIPQILRVDNDLLVDAKLARHMRRADRFIRMATMAALDAWGAAESSCAAIPRQRVGMIVASGFGAHCRGFRFLDGLIDMGDDAALPTDFSHSVHGAASAYIAVLLELLGPSMTITDFEIGFEQAVLLAQCWLAQGVCDRVLVGAVEELGDVMLHCVTKILPGQEKFSPSEGAVFLMLAPGDTPGMAHLNATAKLDHVDLLMIDAPAMASPKTYPPTIKARCTTTFSPYFGHTASSTAFQLLGGLLSLQSAKPLGQMISALSRSSGPVDNAATFKPSCDPQISSLFLTKGTSRP